MTHVWKILGDGKMRARSDLRGCRLLRAEVMVLETDILFLTAHETSRYIVGVPLQLDFANIDRSIASWES